ncbi:hypothetical protein D3C79_1015200 [compost metagenome]
MLVHGTGTQVENSTDVTIGFSSRDPKQYITFAGRQAEMNAKHILFPGLINSSQAKQELVRTRGAEISKMQ